LLKDGRIPKDIKKESKKSALKKQLLYMEKFDHANNAGKIGRMRKVAIWYLKGFENAARTRNAVCHTAGYGELLEVIDSC
jgi:tRNA-dihydrouridine synthase